jgi:hypothetical protein
MSGLASRSQRTCRFERATIRIDIMLRVAETFDGTLMQHFTFMSGGRSWWRKENWFGAKSPTDNKGNSGMSESGPESARDLQESLHCQSVSQSGSGQDIFYESGDTSMLSISSPAICDQSFSQGKCSIVPRASITRKSDQTTMMGRVFCLHVLSRQRP